LTVVGTEEDEIAGSDLDDAEARSPREIQLFRALASSMVVIPTLLWVGNVVVAFI
jgi:hypothetical protein